MTMKELRKKNVKELNDELLNLLYKQFNLRMQIKSEHGLKQTHLFKQIRRDIARINTLLTEKVSNL